LYRQVLWKRIGFEDLVHHRRKLVPFNPRFTFPDSRTEQALDQDTIDRFEAIQLFTASRLQESQKDPIPEGDSFSWFDLVILDTPAKAVPRVENGVSLVWQSHHNDSAHIHPFGLQGRLYDVEDDEVPDVQHLALALKGALKVRSVFLVLATGAYDDNPLAR
jgi:hypothetical protein